MKEKILWLTIQIFGSLPFGFRTKLGATLGYLVSFIPSRDRKITLLQLEKILGSDKSIKLMRSIYANFGSTFFECLNLNPIIKDPERYIEFPDWDEAQRLLAQKRGIVALTAHVGNWDAMGAYFASKKIPLLAVAKQVRDPAIQSVLVRLRASFGFDTVWRANRKGIAHILNYLNQGKVVAALIDQDTRVSSIAVDFFGKSVSTPYTIIELGKKANSMFVSAFVTRGNKGKFIIRTKEIPDFLSEHEILKEYNLRLEKTIRENPTQWAWMHKRWRTTSDGTTLSGKEYINYLQSIPKKA